MTDLLTTITGFSFLGAFVAFMIAAVILKFKSLRLTLVLGAAGLLGGWLGMMLYIFLTGGVQNDSVWAVIIPVTLTIMFCFIILKANKIKIRFPLKVKRPKWMTDKGIAIILFGCLFLALAYMALPSSYGTTMSICSISMDEDDLPNGKLVEGFSMVEYDGEGISFASTSNQIGIDIQKAAVKFPRIAEDPEAGGYIEFKVQFAVSGYSWDQPYIKLFLFQDNDDSGTLTSGDDIWAPAYMKYHLSSGGTSGEGHWKSWLIYGPTGQNDPMYQCSVILFTSGSYQIMPLISTDDFEQVWDDSGKTFQNTPESYTSPEDQFSMQVNSQGYLTFIEDSWNNWVGYNVGTAKTISGKIYCPAEVAGHSHGLVVQAFDYRFENDPFDNSATPLKTATKTFTVSSGGGGGDDPPVIDISWPTWTVLGVLGVACAGGTAVVVKYGSKMIKP